MALPVAQGPVALPVAQGPVALPVAQGPVLLTSAEIPNLRMVTYGRRKAHQLLHRLRQDCATNDTMMVDLADEPGWRNYLANHPQAREIIGAGVVGFEGRFVDALEPNRGTLNLPGVYGQHRFDFVVRRVDGTAMRLHPSEKQDGKPVCGRLEDWEIGTRAPTPGQASATILGGASASRMGMWTWSARRGSTS